jgi:nucleoside-diphosphate-sugar epimerase
MQRWLLVGCGDIAMRLIPQLLGHYHCYGLVRSHAAALRLRQHGVVPVMGDLDQPASLRRLQGLAHGVIHLAPPAGQGHTDNRTRRLLAALSHGDSLPQRFIYISTSGVYGQRDGSWLDETSPAQPGSPRGHRRWDAEQQVRAWSRRLGIRSHIVRVPGIYAADRLPLGRLQAGTPALHASEDSYTNHIHADDLARILLAVMQHGRSQRIYHATDGQPMLMGDYFDLVATHAGLPLPPRISRQQAQVQIAPGLLSFMQESRRLRGDRIGTELGVRLRYPDVASLLHTLPHPDTGRTGQAT